MLFRSRCRQSDCHLVPSKERQRDGWIETRGHGCLRRLPSGVVRYPFQDAGLLRPGRLCPPAGKEQDRQLLQEPLIGRASAGWGAPVFGGTRRKRETHRSTRVLVDWLHARDGGRPLISTGVVFASRGPPRFAPGMNRNSRPNHSPAPCPRASTPALPRQSEARYPHPRRRHRRRRGPRRTVGVAERPDRPGRRGARYRRPSRPARRSSEGGHADRLSRTVHAWVGWDGSVSRQSMVSMTIIRQTRHPWNRPPSPIPGRMRVRKSLPSPIVAAGGRVRPRSGTHIDPCPIGRSRSGVRFAEGGAHGGRVRPGFR